LAKDDIAQLIMTSGTSHSLSFIIFAKWQHASQSWSWGCILEYRISILGEVEFLEGQWLYTIRKSDGGLLYYIDRLYSHWHCDYYAIYPFGRN